MNRCNLKEFGRDRAYFDFGNMQEMPKYRLKIASGYKASMEVYNNKLLLCTELAFKLINFDTVWDILQRHYRESGQDYKQAVTNYLVGQTVVTKYLLIYI